MRLQTHILTTLVLSFSVVACEVIEGDDDGDDNANCPAQLPGPQSSCSGLTCTAELPAATSNSWLAVSWISSDINTNDNPNIEYQRTSSALTARRSLVRELARERHDPAQYEALYHPRIDDRIRAEAALRSEWPSRIEPAALSGTGIRGRTADLLPPGVHRQTATCSRSSPACGTDAVCVIDGAGEGVCESAVTIKLRAAGQNVDIPATVKAVGTYAAILVDDADNVSQSDVSELLERFDSHIAPIDHMLFGEPKNAQGQDFDGNGVTLVLLTSKVRNISANLVGFFYAPDLMDPAQNPASNGADLLYMSPPGGSTPIDAVSGTLGHEYQHLINALAKSSRGSSAEEAWLDEGLSGFAEDLLGYGGDAFTNVSRYLDGVSETSLTGFGLVNTTEEDADSAERRGMAHLFVRVIFEQSGGADLGSSAGQLTDRGGVAQVKKLVQTPSTGVDVITPSNAGKSLHEWLGILMTTVALDGTQFTDVSCNRAFQLREPVMSGFTGRQVGINLRGSFMNFQGTPITLRGPATSDLMTESVPVPSNGGEIRTVEAGTGTVQIGVTVPDEDYKVGLRPIPTGL